eukprot:COSAG02_NODE_322_length_24779_cov_14.118233_19_plen_127_part_00
MDLFRVAPIQLKSIVFEFVLIDWEGLGMHSTSTLRGNDIETGRKKLGEQPVTSKWPLRFSGWVRIQSTGGGRTAAPNICSSMRKKSSISGRPWSLLHSSVSSMYSTRAPAGVVFWRSPRKWPPPYN